MSAPRCERRGLLERATSYKDKVAKGLPSSMGLFCYPVLMAADILVYRSSMVPVGKDQVQHVEMAQDMCTYFNEAFGQPVLRRPEFRLSFAPNVPGLDGGKMSKSYNNTIPIFAEPDEIRRLVMSMVTDPQRIKRTDPGRPEVCNVCQLHRFFGSDYLQIRDGERTARTGCVDTKQLLAERIIVLGAEVDDPIANRITAQLLLLSARDPRADISLYINSPGGSVTAGLAIYDTMRVIPNDVSTLAVGFAASMGQFLLGAGTPGKRFALPNARIMMHQPSAGIQGTAADVEVQAANLKTMKRRVNELQSQHTGQTVEQITADSERDRWFSADEAKSYGIVDHVVASLDDVRPAPAVRRVGLR